MALEIFDALLPYFGGKRKLCPVIFSYIAKHLPREDWQGKIFVGSLFGKEPSGRLRFLEKEEIVRLLPNCNEYLRPIIVVALNTGMRRGEIFHLKWHDIDFKRDIIYLYETKNGEKRVIPMNEIVKSTLIKVKKDPNSPYIFHNDDGRPYYNLRKSFFTACKKAGIINFHFHDLRYTFAP